MNLCVAMHADSRPNVANPGKLLLRLLSYIFKNYGFACIVVVICLFITVFRVYRGTLFMQTLIDDYIIPLTKQASPDFTELAHAIGRVAIFYACGVLASFAQSKNYGIRHTGNTPELKKRYVHPYGRTPDPLL